MRAIREVIEERLLFKLFKFNLNISKPIRSDNCQVKVLNYAQILKICALFSRNILGSRHMLIEYSEIIMKDHSILSRKILESCISFIRFVFI